MMIPSDNRLWFFMVTGLLVGGLSGCSDPTQEAVEPKQTADISAEALGSMPGDAYQYRGQIEGRPVFVSDFRDFVPGWDLPAYQYTPGEGWRERILPQAAWQIADNSARIVKSAGDYYYLERLTDSQSSTIHRSTDGGHTWEAVDDTPANASRLLGDDEALYVFQTTLDPDTNETTRRLWRSKNGAGNWDVIHENLGSLRTKYIAANGRIAVSVKNGQSRKIEISTDHGDTWKTVGDQSSIAELFAARRTWHRLDDALVTTRRFPGDNPRATGIGVWKSPTEFGWTAPEHMPGNIAWMATAGDTIYATTTGGDLGKLTGSPSNWLTQPPQWQPVSLPSGETLRRSKTHRPVFGFSDGSVAVLTVTGLWRGDGTGKGWKDVRHRYASPDYVVETADGIVAGPAGQFFRHSPDADGWTRMQLDPDFPTTLGGAILKRTGDQLFALTSTPKKPPTIFKAALDSSTAEQLWRDDAVTQSYRGVLTRPSARLFDTDGAWIVASAGSFREVVASEGTTIIKSSGGGIFSVDKSTGESTKLTSPGDGKPELLVQSMTRHNGDAWVVTATHGVWRVKLDGSGATRMHTGLPDKPHLDVLDLVIGVFSTDDALYAFSSDELYVFENGEWTPMELQPFYDAAQITGLDPLGGEPNTNAIVDVDRLGDRLLVATLTGLYTVDPETGDFLPGRLDFDHPIYKLIRTSSDLYVSLWQGGLYRIQSTK